MCANVSKSWNWRHIYVMDYFLILLCTISLTSAAFMGQDCDWTGSGLAISAEGKGVTPVYLRCTTGRVTWQYPRGALRVLLRLPSQDREFRACIKLHPDDDKKDLSARLFLEGPRSLLPLYSHKDGGNRANRCFNSKNGQAAIYVEATDNDSVTKRIAEFEYDLEPLPKGVYSFDPKEECRPCTTEELAHAFCTSDLVTRGTIYGVENREDLEVTEMLIRVTKIITDTPEDIYSREINSNSIFSGDEAVKEVSIHVAQHCGVSHGVGEYVFMARRKLGDLTLRCALRLENWAMLVHKLSEEGKAQCILKS